MNLVFNVDGVSFSVPLRAGVQIRAGICHSEFMFPAGFGEITITREAVVIRHVGSRQGHEVFLLLATSAEWMDHVFSKLSAKRGIEFRPDVVFEGSEVKVVRDTLNGTTANALNGLAFYQYCQRRFEAFVDVNSRAWQDFIQKRPPAVLDPVPAPPRRQLDLVPTPAPILGPYPEVVIPVPRRPSLEPQALAGFMSYQELASMFPLLVNPNAWPFTFQVMKEAGEDFRYFLVLSFYLRNLIGPEQLQILKDWVRQERLCLFLDNYARVLGF